MSGNDKKSRRKMLGAGVVTGLAVITAGHLAYRRKKSKEPKRKLPGHALLLPKKELKESAPFSFSLSPDGKKICVVHGNLVRNFASIADFPVDSQKDYRIVAEFSNCYKMDGVSWSSFDPDLLGCKLTSIDIPTTLPDVMSDEAWRALGEKKVFSESDFFGEFVSFSSSGGKIVHGSRLPPSFRESSTASSAWTSPDTFFCADGGVISKLSLGAPEKPVEIFDWKQKKKDYKIDGGKIHSMAWMQQSQRCRAVVYAWTGEKNSVSTLHFDAQGNIVDDMQPLMPQPPTEQLVGFQLDSSGNTMVSHFSQLRGVGEGKNVNKTSDIYSKCAVYLRDMSSNEEHYYDIPIKDDVSFVCGVSSTGTVLLAFADNGPRSDNFLLHPWHYRYVNVLG